MSNALTDGYLVPGAGGFETMAHAALIKHKSSVKGRAKLGVRVTTGVGSPPRWHMAPHI